MRVLSAAALCILVFCLSVGSHAQPSPPRQDIYQALKGGWVVTYNDRRYGLVQGRAYFDLDIDFGTVTFQLPQNAAVTLKAQSITATSDGVRVVWSSQTDAPNPPFDPFGKTVKTPGQMIRLGLGSASEQIRLKTPTPVDGTITSHLRFYPTSKSFAGFWGQRVDAVTGASGGARRHGLYSHGAPETGGGIVAGEEYWVRPAPAIKDTFVIRNQFSMGLVGPAYPYPFQNGRVTSELDTRRYLFVYGKGLPQRRGEGITVVSDDPAIDYYVYALKTTYADGGGSMVDTALRDQAFERMETILSVPKPPYGREPGDDFMIIEAKLKPGVQPGTKGFSINGVETAWTLRFGDHRAILGFARDLTIDLSPQLRAQATFESELTDLVYAPEEVIIELHTDVEVPLESFDVLVAKNGKLLTIGDERTVKLVKQSASGSLKTYRSEPIQIIAPDTQRLYSPATRTITAIQGDSLHLALHGPQVLNLVNPAPTVRVLDTPANLLKAIKGPSAPRTYQWRGAVLKAAQCAGMDGANQLTSDQISRQEADRYRDMVVGTLWNDVETILGTRINIGEHAGAIMMQPIFQAMLEAAEATYAAELDDNAIMGLRRTLAVNVTAGEHPLSKILVQTPNGEGLFFSTTFYDDVLEDTYGLTGKAREAFKVSSMRDARTQLLAQIKTSIEKVKETDPCDVKDMLYLTGLGTQAIQGRTYAGLMKRKTITETYENAGGAQVPVTRTQWVANRQARARVANVSLYAETLKAQENLSDEYWDAYLMTVSLLSLPFGIGAEFFAVESVVYATALMDMTDLVVNLAQESTKQYAESVELEFVRGASIVIGSDRLRRAIQDDTSGLMAYFKTLASAAQAANGALSLRSAARLERSVQRGHRVTKRLMGQRRSTRLKQFKALKPHAQGDVFSAITTAAAKRAKLGRNWLDANELRALDFERSLLREGLASSAVTIPGRPTWARGLSQEVWNSLDDMIARADVQRLVSENAAEMNTLLRQPEALDVLRLPQRDFASFKRAVSRLQNRAPTRGADFVNQARAANGNPEGLFFDTKMGTSVDGFQSVDTAIYAGQSPAGTKYGQFTRGRRPDPVFETGKDLFVFDVAQAYRSVQADALIATPGRFVPGNPQLDLSGLRPTRQLPFRGGPRWVYDVKIPLRDTDPGVPFVMFNNLRSYTSLGFEYADPQLGGIMLKNISSANTTGQLAWLRNAYPTKSIDDLFRYTLSYRYAQNTAQQLGFRITDVKVVGAVPGSPGFTGASPLEQMVDGMWFDPGVARTFQDVQAAKKAFLETYAIPGNPPVPRGFSVYLKVEPL